MEKLLRRLNSSCGHRDSIYFAPWIHLDFQTANENLIFLNGSGCDPRNRSEICPPCAKILDEYNQSGNVEDFGDIENEICKCGKMCRCAQDRIRDLMERVAHLEKLLENK